MIDEILRMADGLDVHETRREEPEYRELVVYAKDIASWNKIFEEALGQAAKPSGSKATAEHATMTDEYGGIEKTQTLYLKQDKSALTLVMLWPWQDKVHVTVKIVFLKGG
jgi:hypothetical protein